MTTTETTPATAALTPQLNAHEPPADLVATTPETTEDAPKGNKEARYRVERNEARNERDSLTARIESLQIRELERIASRSISNPADLLTLSGKTLADLLDDNGDVDPELVHAVAVELLGSRPGLKPRTPATDPSQGGTGTPAAFTPSWENLLQS